MTARATCNDSSREICSLERHKPGNIFFFFIQKTNSKLELKKNPPTIANDTNLVAKLLLSAPIVRFFHTKSCLS